MVISPGSSEDSDMFARKLVYYGLVLTPALMLGFIGLGARAYRETFEFDRYNAEQDALASVYIDLVRSASDMPALVNGESDLQKIRAVGWKWSEAVLSGRAKTVPVINLDESTTWVLCEEIASSKSRLAWGLWRAAQHELERGRYDRAAKDLAVSYVVSQATKGMNLFTIAQGSKRQEMVLNRIMEIQPYLSLNTRRELKGLFARVREMEADTAERLKIVGTALKVSKVESVSTVFGSEQNFTYWKRLYTNAQKSVSSLESCWVAYCSSADDRVCRTGPMPKELVYKYDHKRPKFASRPMFAGAPPSYRYFLAQADH